MLGAGEVTRWLTENRWSRAQAFRGWNWEVALPPSQHVTWGELFNLVRLLSAFHETPSVKFLGCCWACGAQGMLAHWKAKENQRVFWKLEMAHKEGYAHHTP